MAEKSVRLVEDNLPCRRKRRRPQRRLMHVLMEDIQRAGVTEDDGTDGVRWRQMIQCGNP